MLALPAKRGEVDYVIVHKIDRLARNRADDVQIQLAIERAGAQLVSVSENVDATPSGNLIRNIMADLDEFHSANLATEILKGSIEKGRRGATPGLASIGYINVRQLVDGREIRTVGLDEERAPFVRRAFELYATGEYAVLRLHKRLTDEGLTVRPTAKRPAQPLALSKLHTLLRNRYYLGLVAYRGVEYPGQRETVISNAVRPRRADPG